MTYCGIDNGISGALAVLESDGSVRLHKTPVMELGDRGTFIDIVALAGLILDGRDPAKISVVMEWGTKNPQFGAEGNWSTGFSCGAVFSMLRLKQVRISAVYAREWQKTMLAGHRGGGEGTKTAAVAAVRRLYPQVNLIPPRCRKPHDGMADALLMAHWGREHRL